uniref:G_PROTEIN_RECEP_F1_2 domain-containing protein n=1 Tax=Haemonchus contortus TaxID=6289 RepID=A0A7I4YXK6_HAECO
MPSLAAEVFTTAITVTLCFVGLFGNCCILWAHAFDRHLRHKICYIVTVIAFLHAVCLLNELYLEVRQLRFHGSSRSECFRQTCIYVFVFMAQAAMFLMLAVDHLFAVTIPLKHNMFPTLPYVLYLCIPPLLFASAIVASSIVFMNDDHIDLCTPIQAMPPNVQSVMYVIIILNTAVLLTLLSVITIVRSRKKRMRTPSSQAALSVTVATHPPAGHEKASRHSTTSRTSYSSELKMMRSFIMLVMFFVCSWCVSTVATHIVVRYLQPDSDISIFVQTYVVITVLPTYCQCYFVSYFRSPHHRTVYRKQLKFLFPCLVWDKEEREGNSRPSAIKVRSISI